MTFEEMAALKVGDWVEVKSGGKWRLAVVTYMSPEGVIRARRLGRTLNGHAFPVRIAQPWQCRPTEYRPEPANVYADFLDDHGHADAAAALREAFPLGDMP